MIRLEADSRLAAESPDHLHPFGTAGDNSVWPAFNAKIFALWPQPLRLLDLGCAGGGLVRSVLEDGGFAVGIEGSDYSRLQKRAEWAVIPHNLFVADISRPFSLWSGELRQLFDAVTAWEVLEHIPRSGLEQLLVNVREHLAPGGRFMGSMATVGCAVDGVVYHATVEPAEWWLELFAANGLELDAQLTAYIEPDWVRGPRTLNESFCAAFRRRA